VPEPVKDPIPDAPEAVAARAAAAARAASKLAAAAEESEEILDAADAAVQRALVVGDYRAAVGACVGAGRHADALVLAGANTRPLFSST